MGRYYDPATGQFLSVDPLVDETGQPYPYTGDDPVNGVDPDGLDCGIFSVICGAYDATAGGVKTAGAVTTNGLHTAGAAMLSGAEYAGAFLWDTGYALAGQPGPYCGIWGASGFADVIDDTLLAVDGAEGTNSNGIVGEGTPGSTGEEDESVSSEGTIHSILQGGEGARNIDPNEVLKNSQNVYYDENGDQVFVWEQASGESQVTIRNPATGRVITSQWSTEGFVQSQVESGRWWSLNG